MLHEILLALLGHCGDVVIETSNGFEVAPDLGFVSSADKETIDRVVQLGYWYHRVQRFVENASAGVPDGTGTSPYMTACCAGVDEVLEAYRTALGQLEQDVLEEPTLPVSHLHLQLMDYFVLLPALHSLVEDVQAGRVRGGQLLDALHRRASCGSPVLQDAFLIVLQHCTRVMLNQLAAWVAHGLLLDAHHDFFIRHNPPPAARLAEARASSLHGSWADGEGGVGSGAWLRGRLLEESSAGGVMGDAVPQLVPSEYGWSAQFGVDLAMLPTRIVPLRVAECALFVGKAAQVLRQFEEREGRVEWLQRDSEAFAAALGHLKEQPVLRPQSLEAVMTRIRAIAANRLWHVAVTDVRLPDTVAAMRDYFLLGNGQFYQAFLEFGEELMGLPPTLSAERDINSGPWAAAATAAEVEERGLFSKLRLSLDSHAFDMTRVGQLQEDTHAVGDMRVQASARALYLPAPHDSARAGTAAPTAAATAAAAAAAAASVAVDNSLHLHFAAARTAPGSPLAMQAATGHDGSMPGAVGAVWHARRVSLAKRFSAQFRCELWPERGAQGMALVLQMDSAHALGRGADGIGFDGLRRAIVVSLRCGSRGPDGQHQPARIAVHTSGSGSTLRCDAETRCPTIDDGKPHTVCVRGGWSSTDYRLAVFVDDPHYARPVLSCPLKSRLVLETGVGVWIGFTAAASVPPEAAAAPPSRAASERASGASGGTALSIDEEATQACVRVRDWAFQSSREDRERAADAWHGLRLAFEVEWPLQLVVTQDTIALHNSMFRMLLSIRRVSHGLRRAWQQLMSVGRQHTPRRLSAAGSSSGRSSGSSSDLACCTWLQHAMSFTLDSLLFYLQVDVAEAEQQQLQKLLTESRDFEALMSAHAEYTERLARGFFLRQRSISLIIEQLLETCRNMCEYLSLMEKGKAREARSTPPQLAQDFKRLSHLLIDALQRASPALSLRLEFNGYFSRHRAVLASQ